MSAHTSIRCDGCGKGYTWKVYHGLSVSIGRNRDSLKPDGWHFLKKTGEPTRDICPQCWEQGVR